MSFNKLMKTVDKVENKPIPGVFDISSFLLPTNEVVKNILIMENNLSEEDAELMVDGFVPSAPKSPVDPSLPDSGLAPVDDATKASGSKVRKKSKSQKEIENLKNDSDTKHKTKLIDESVNSNIELVSDTDTGAPLSSKSPYHKKAKEILLLIKEKVTQFFRKVKELIKEIAATVVSIISSIPGSTLMVAPFAFNVPGMITMLMQMISILSMLSSKVADLTSFFKYFKMLPLVLSPKDLNKVSGIIDKSYNSISLAFKPLEKSIEKFQSVSLSTIKSLSDNPKSARTVTSRLRKLKYITWSLPGIGNPPFNKYSIRGINNVEEDDRDEVEDILTQWDVVFLNNRKIAVRRKKAVDGDGKEINIDDLIKGVSKIDELVSDIKVNLPDTDTDDNFIYDVRFSDGRTLSGITRQEVDGLVVAYNVIYSENVKYSFL